MKLSQSLAGALLVATSFALSGCGGGVGVAIGVSSDILYPSDIVYVDTNPYYPVDTTPYYPPTDSGPYYPGDNGSGSTDNGGYDNGGSSGSGSSGGSSTSGCDASGCNSFGSGGSKNTGLLASKVTKAQINAKAMSVASEFQMSLSAATKLTQLAVQVKGMKQQRQLTQADRDAIAASAFKVAGVTANQVNNAVHASLQNGNQKAIDDVMNQAAENLGMPSGATFRDKIVPLFEGRN